MKTIETNFASILPAGKIMQQNSTHVAVKESNKIKIYIKGFTFEDLTIQPEYLYSIAAENIDDLFAIFERYDEDNRVNLNEFLN